MSEQLAKWFVEFSSQGQDKVAADADRLRGKLESSASAAQRSASTMSRFAQAVAMPFRAVSNFAGMAQQKLRELRSSLQNVSQLTRGLALGVGGSIAGLVAAGLRDTAQGEQLAAAFKGLSQAVATLFLPVIQGVTMGVSILSAAIMSLTSEQKATILTWVGWAAAIVGVIIVLPKLIGFLSLAFGAVQLVTGALVFLASNPIVAGLLLVAAAIAGIAYESMKMNEELEKAIKNAKEYIANLTTGDVNISEVGKKVAASSPENKLKTAEAELARYMAEQQRIVNQSKAISQPGLANANAIAKDILTRIPGLGPWLEKIQPDAAKKTKTQRELQIEFAAIEKKIAEAQAAIGMLGAGKGVYMPPKEGAAQEKEKGKGSFADRMSKFMDKMFNVMGKSGDELVMKIKQKPAALEGIQDTFDRMLKAANSPADDTNKMILEQQKKANAKWDEIKEMWKEFIREFSIVGS